MPDIDIPLQEPVFLIVLSPPYSGSTALAQLLNTGHHSMLLHRKGEGQWLVPGMCQADRWDHRKPVLWDSVRAVWLAKIREVEELTGRVDVVIEKSPPNLVRVKELLKTFPNHQIVTFVRDPFANCSSIFFRHYVKENSSVKDRIATLQHLARGWLDRSRLIERWREQRNSVHFSYEDLCSDPSTQVQAIVDKVPRLDGIDIGSPLSVKGYRAQPLTNHNARQIGLLCEEELDGIAQVLRKHESMLERLGYTSDWTRAIDYHSESLQ
ncbi:MAG: sulfotransferase [Pseudomonadota bacterium]